MSAFIRLLCVCLTISLLVAPTANAADDKPHVFINTASDLGYISGVNLGMVQFADIVRGVGFTITHGQKPGFADGSAFVGVDVMILLEPSFVMTTNDVIALRQWIRNGGILITGEWYDPARIDGFLEEFGVEHLYPETGDFGMTIPSSSPLSSPLTVNSLISRNRRALNIIDDTKMEMILRFDDGMAAMTRSISYAGKGEIITLGCLRMFFDSSVNGDIDQEDNEKLVHNLFVYIKNRLTGDTQAGYDLKLRKFRSKGGSDFLLGDEIKLVVKIKNLGKETGEATRVAFYIERVSTMPGPAAMTEFASATVPKIKANKKVKIVKRAFLPDDLEPMAAYKLIAVVDPDELTDDTNTGNNSATSKKIIRIVE
jgi:hypothetical protein